MCGSYMFLYGQLHNSLALLWPHYYLRQSWPLFLKAQGWQQDHVRRGCSHGNSPGNRVGPEPLARYNLQSPTTASTSSDSAYWNSRQTTGSSSREGEGMGDTRDANRSCCSKPHSQARSSSWEHPGGKTWAVISSCFCRHTMRLGTQYYLFRFLITAARYPALLHDLSIIGCRQDMNIPHWYFFP